MRTTDDPIRDIKMLYFAEEVVLLKDSALLPDTRKERLYINPSSSPRLQEDKVFIRSVIMYGKLDFFHTFVLPIGSDQRW